MSKRLTLILGLTALILASGSIALYRAATGSLPMLDGEVQVAGLAGKVTIERDRYGVPTIRGSNRVDVARATGFVHGQDRFFQMDLLRRSTAGELAELFGAAAADFDRWRRLHRLRSLARSVIDRAAPDERALLEAYTDGVNSGLKALSVVPFEYLILRVEPEPWQPEDIVLGNLAMFFELTDHDASRESGYAELLDGIPELLGRFVFAPGNRWDAPLVGGAWEVPPVPGPDVCDLGGTVPEGSRLGPQPEFQFDLPVAGSNSWAVAGYRADAGRAILANDMHLGLNETDPANPDAYLTPEGYVPFDEYEEIIEIKGGELTHLGANGYWLGARGQQIRDALAALERPGIEDMLPIQLDDRALLLQEWRDVLLKALTDNTATAYPWRDELRDILERWDGRAGIDSVSYRIVRELRRQVVDVMLRGILAGCGDFDEPVLLAATNQVEGPIWQLITEQPGHLLSPAATICPEFSYPTTVHRNGSRWRRVTKPTATFTCPAVRAGIRCLRFSPPATMPGRRVSRCRSCRDREYTP